MSQYDRIVSVKRWRVVLHLVYDHNHVDGTPFTEHAVSDWTGTVDGDPSIGIWSGDLHVAVDGFWKLYLSHDDHVDIKTITAFGPEKCNFQIWMKPDGYEFGQGHCNTQFPAKTTIHCPRDGERDGDRYGSVTYCKSWWVKAAFPPRGTTLSDSETINRYLPFGPAQHGQLSCSKNDETITVRWEFHPAIERTTCAGHVFAETASLSGTPDKLKEARRFIAGVACKRCGDGIAPAKFPSETDLQNPHVKEVWELCQAACKDAESDDVKECKNFVIWYSDDAGQSPSKSPSRMGADWPYDHSDKITASYGPFKNPIEPKGENIFVFKYCGVP